MEGTVFDNIRDAMEGMKVGSGHGDARGHKCSDKIIGLQHAGKDTTPPANLAVDVLVHGGTNSCRLPWRVIAAPRSCCELCDLCESKEVWDSLEGIVFFRKMGQTVVDGCPILGVCFFVVDMSKFP